MASKSRRKRWHRVQMDVSQQPGFAERDWERVAASLYASIRREMDRLGMARPEDDPVQEHSDPSRSDYGSKHPGGKGTVGRVMGETIRTSNVEAAAVALAAGRRVELQHVDQVTALLDVMHKEVKALARQGKDAPNYDLCRVTVKGTSLFCGGAVTDPRTGKRIPRKMMPQLRGQAASGTQAARLPADKAGDVDASSAFPAILARSHIGFRREKVLASHLKASQNELVGAKVAGMVLAANAGRFDPGKNSIFVSQDNYVIDGHHRWAAQVARDTSDGRLGDLTMNVVRIDMPIIDVLHAAEQFTRAFGIRTKGVSEATTGPDDEAPLQGAWSDDPETMQRLVESLEPDFLALSPEEQRRRLVELAEPMEDE